MKNWIVVFALNVVALAVFGQTESPVKWSFESRKKSDKVYEVVLTATVNKPWHIYSQFTPEGGPLPTKIRFASNPIVSVEGTSREAGNLLHHHDKNFGVEVRYFSDKVEFIQTIRLKGVVKTGVRGSIEYMVCDDSKCLSPVKQPFDVKLQ
jgi:hypothetical protein